MISACIVCPIHGKLVINIFHANQVIMNLSVTDPAFLFPGISLLFLAYTNRYLALASVVRKLNEINEEGLNENRGQQIKSLHTRILLIKYMQVFGVFAFLCCVLAMFCLVFSFQQAGQVLFIASLVCMTASLVLSLSEILKSGQSLSIELARTGINKKTKNSTR